MYEDGFNIEEWKAKKLAERQEAFAAQEERNEVKNDEYQRRSSRPDGTRSTAIFRGGY